MTNPFPVATTLHRRMQMGWHDRGFARARVREWWSRRLSVVLAECRVMQNPQTAYREEL